MIVIDGSHLIHRAVYATRDRGLVDTYGNATNGVVTVLSMINKLIKKFDVGSGVIFLLDSGVPVHRRETFREYKANKSIMHSPGETVDDNLLSSVNKLSEKDWLESGIVVDKDFLNIYALTRTILHKEILPYIGCLSLMVSNCEADDIAAVWCDVMKDKGEEILLVTSDKDWYQLLDDNVSIHDPLKYDEVTLSSYLSSADITYSEMWRDEWLYRKAIVGDPSDGIPGIQFVGKGTANAYAKQLVEGVQYQDLSRPPKASNKGFESLKGSESEVSRNKTLMDLRYAINNNLPIISEIKGEILKSSIYNVDEDYVCEVLHNRNMLNAASYVDQICSKLDCCDLRHLIKNFY